jgi:cytochrome d ubiquinol oxidase subunit II
MTTLGVLWFALVGVLLAGYALFDGFDLGLGTLYPFIAKTDDDKEIVRSSIGPVWDGNEVWLLAGGGAIFAAFPNVYAAVFSGFYLALMLVLFALIFRAVSFEFYAHDPSWRKVWDWAFFLGSALPALLFGVAAGNIVRGVPLDKMGEFTGNFFTLLNPYSLVLGVLGLVMFMWQGAAWLALKSENALYDRAVKARSLMAWVFVALVVVATAATFLLVPRAASQVMASPAGWLFLVLLLASIVWGRLGANGKAHTAWYAASLAPVALIGLWAVAIFPRLVPAINDDALSLTIANSASSELTLTVMTIIAAIGVPLVLFYFYLIYRIFAGKTQIGGEGY